MDNGLYYRLLNYPKSVLIQYLLQEMGENIDFKKMDAIGWERTSGKMERKVENLEREKRGLEARGYEKKDPRYQKLEKKLKQKEFLLKWAKKKSGKTDKEV